MHRQFDREEEQIERDYREGRIPLDEHQEAVEQVAAALHRLAVMLRDLHSEFREAAAQDAYRRELDNWP